jgi:hypothetical protein
MMTTMCDRSRGLDGLGCAWTMRMDWKIAVRFVWLGGLRAEWKIRWGDEVSRDEGWALGANFFWCQGLHCREPMRSSEILDAVEVLYQYHIRGPSGVALSANGCLTCSSSTYPSTDPSKQASIPTQKSKGSDEILNSTVIMRGNCFH